QCSALTLHLHSFPTRRSSDLILRSEAMARRGRWGGLARRALVCAAVVLLLAALGASGGYFWLQREFSTSGPATAGSLIQVEPGADRKSTRLNSSHVKIPYAVL